MSAAGLEVSTSGWGTREFLSFVFESNLTERLRFEVEAPSLFKIDFGLSSGSVGDSLLTNNTGAKVKLSVTLSTSLLSSGCVTGCIGSVLISYRLHCVNTVSSG
jgi:hypothetical protein